jgi:hypothetical protein
VGLEHDVISVDVAGDFSCALTSEHKARCWGSGFGPTPGPWDESNAYLAISVADSRLCGLRANRKIYCGSVWESLPRVEPVPDLGDSVAAFEIGKLHSCSVTVNGGVKCWGNNDRGQLGIGKTNSQPTPVEASGFYTNVTAVAAQGENSCVLKDDASVECWGATTCGGVQNVCFDSWQPVEIGGVEEGVRAVSGMCAVTNNGGVKCWDNHAWLAQPVAGLESGVVAVAVGSAHACALTDTGGVKCWGSGTIGQCGNGVIECSSTPSDVVGLTSNVRTIAAAREISCAVTTDGEVKCWGDDLYGSWGSPPIVCYSFGGRYTDYCYPTPVDIVGLPAQVQEIALGGDACVLTASGEVTCWGGGVRVVMDTGAQAVTGGWVHMCVLVETGGVQCWGNNEYGQVGNGTTGGQFDDPVDVVGVEEGVTAIAAGGFHTCAVTESGGVRCWGRNDRGQLGMNTGQTPIDVLGFGGVDVEHHDLPWLAR